MSVTYISLLKCLFEMVKPKYEASLKRESGSALFKKRNFKEKILIKIYREKTSNRYIQSNSDTNSSTSPPFAKSPVDNFISSSAEKLKHTAQQEWQYRMNQYKTVTVW